MSVINICPGECVITNDGFDAMMTFCGVTPHGQKTGTSPSRIVTETPKPTVTPTTVPTVTPTATPKPVIGFTDNKDGSALITIDNLPGEGTSAIRTVHFATWSKAGDQDDLVWYVGTYKSGKYQTTVKLSNHKHEGQSKEPDEVGCATLGGF